MERRTRAIGRNAIPSVVLELLTEKTVEQVFTGLAEIGAACQDCPVETGLGFAVEEGSAARESVPSDVPSHPTDGTTHFLTFGVGAELFEQRKTPNRRHPAWIIAAAPI